MNSKGKFSEQLLKIIGKSIERKIYGSVEIYFEEGRITQVTQRIINKIHKTNKVSNEPLKKVPTTQTNQL